MATANKIRNNIIDKLLTISNKDYLSALYQLVERSDTGDCVKLTDEQKKMLALSEQDIQNGNLIPQSKLDKEDREWLNEL